MVFAIVVHVRLLHITASKLYGYQKVTKQAEPEGRASPHMWMHIKHEAKLGKKHKGILFWCPPFSTLDTSHNSATEHIVSIENFSIDRDQCLERRIRVPELQEEEPSRYLPQQTGGMSQMKEDMKGAQATLGKRRCCKTRSLPRWGQTMWLDRPSRSPDPTP